MRGWGTLAELCIDLRVTKGTLRVRLHAYWKSDSKICPQRAVGIVQGKLSQRVVSHCRGPPAQPAPSDPGFDYALAECAAAAAKALTRPGGWSQLNGCAKECYRRLLMFVSFMHMAGGHNSAKVGHFVSDYVPRVRNYENADTAQRKVESSEPFPLSCLAVGIKGSSGGASLAVPAVAAGMPTGYDGHLDNPYARAAAAFDSNPTEEPPSKKLRAGSGAPHPGLPECTQSVPAIFTLPFGAVSPPR